VSREEPLDRAESEREASLSEAAADLFDGSIPSGAERRNDGFTVGIYAT